MQKRMIDQDVHIKKIENIITSNELLHKKDINIIIQLKLEIQQLKQKLQKLTENK